MARLDPIEAERLRIIPFAEQHLHDGYVGWLNDPDVVRYSEQRHRRHTRESCRAYAERIANSDDFFSAIETVEPADHVGNITVSVDQPNSIADIAIMIGERSAWGHGFGFEAWNAVLTTLLSRERFRKVSGGTVVPNHAMVRIMEKAGMQPDGRRPAHYVIDGEAVDVVYYARFLGAG